MVIYDPATFQPAPLPSHRGFHDLRGQVHGHFTFLEYAGRFQKRRHFWLVRCDCGRLSIQRGCVIKSGQFVTCGCSRKSSRGHTWSTARLIIPELIRRGEITRKCAEYRIWSLMKRRCRDPKNPGYYKYGARGIRVCEQWMESFAAFFADMGPRPSVKHSIDRINNDGPYTKENCRWATREEQARNRRNTVIVTYRGVTAPLATHCEQQNMQYGLVYMRIYRLGWDADKAFSQPIIPKPRKNQ